MNEKQETHTDHLQNAGVKAVDSLTEKEKSQNLNCQTAVISLTY